MAQEKKPTQPRSKITATSARVWGERSEAIRRASTENFLDLLRLSGLDSKRDLLFADWSGISFKNLDVRGFDFTGANLRDCDFTGALIDGARFDQAEINGTNLRAAKDWADHLRNWRKRSRAPSADKSLPFFAVFQDAPFAPEMVVLPAGEFLMGSPDDEQERYDGEGPRRKVTISQPFAVGRFAVTFDEWDFAAADGACRGYKPSDENWGRGRRPVINVNWKDAQGYIKWLSKKTGKVYRLLSEAEWEYACRAGTETPFSFGETISTVQANYNGDYLYGSGKKGKYRKKTMPVGSFPANPFGLYDMHGNVWEWCADPWHDNYEGAPTDGSAYMQSKVADAYVVRGGSWVNDPGDLRSACRFRYLTGNRDDNQGFRVGRTLTP